MMKQASSLLAAVLLSGCVAKPDLVVSELEVPAVLVRPATSLAGSTLTVSNVGDAPAEKRYPSPGFDHFVHVDIVVSADENVPRSGAVLASGFREDALLTGGRRQVALPMPPGASERVTELLASMYHDTPPGGYFICARVDPYDTVEESSESNNVTCRPIVVDEDLEPASFCLDFEDSSNPSAVAGLDAAMLYADRGIRFSSGPEIARNPGIADGYQALLQGDVGAERPARSCGTMRFELSPELGAREVRFEARNVGFIPFPVHITAVAFGVQDGVEIEVDRFEYTSRSRLGSLATFVPVTLQVAPDATNTILPIIRVEVEYGTCPPRVMVDNLCVEIRD